MIGHPAGVAQEARARVVRDALLRREEVLEQYRHSLERARRRAGGTPHRLVRQRHDHGIEVGLDGFEALRGRRRQLDR